MFILNVSRIIERNQWGCPLLDENKQSFKGLIIPKRFGRIFSPFINGTFSIKKEKKIKKKVAFPKDQKATLKKLNILNIDNDINCLGGEITFNSNKN